MSEKVKFMSAFLLFATWGSFALMGKTEVQPFIEAIQYALVGLGVYHISRLPK